MTTDYSAWGVNELISELEHRDRNIGHNGWSNYETWRVNLECVDGSYDEETLKGYQGNAHELAERIEMDVIEAIRGYGSLPEDSLAVQYAEAFIDEVNWYEIAELLLDTYGLDEKDEDELTDDTI